jgi:hypothetical protein
LAIGVQCVAYAQSVSTFSQPFEAKVVLGEGDSRAKARELAIDQIKRIAGAAAGSVVESVTALNDNKLTEQIRLISVSLVKLDSIKESLIVEGGNAALKVSATATIDKSELDRLAKELRQDSEKAKAIAKLQADNQALRQELAKVTTDLQKRSSLPSADDLGQRQTKILAALASNEGKVLKVFEKGALLALANRDAEAFDSVTSDLENQVFRPMLQTKITAEVGSVVKTSDRYTVAVKLGWNMPIETYVGVLKKYMREPANSGSSSWDPYANKPVKPVYAEFTRWTVAQNVAPTEIGPRTWNYLVARKVIAVIKAGGVTKEFQLFGSDSGDNFSPRCTNPITLNETWRPEPASICLVSNPPGSATLKGARVDRDKVNPVSFILTQAQASDSFSVDYSIRIVGPKGVEMESPFVSAL